MSQEGYDNLVAELKQLVSVERPKASAAIAEARDKGDLSENSEYDAAKEAQAHLEDKINRIKLTIAEAKIIDTKQLSTDWARFLSRLLSHRACSTRRWARSWKSRFHAALSNCASTKFHSSNNKELS